MQTQYSYSTMVWIPWAFARQGFKVNPPKERFSTEPCEEDGNLFENIFFQTLFEEPVNLLWLVLWRGYHCSLCYCSADSRFISSSTFNERSSFLCCLEGYLAVSAAVQQIADSFIHLQRKLFSVLAEPVMRGYWSSLTMSAMKDTDFSVSKALSRGALRNFVLLGRC